MLPGVVPFPPDFATRYRAKAYWEDKSIASVWEAYCRLYGTRVAVIDGEDRATYADINARAVNLALNLLELGIKPLDRLVVQLPNRLPFVYLYLALQKIGAIPVMALPAHRYLEISQFVEIASAIGCVMPDRHRDFDFRDLMRRIQKEQPHLIHGIVLGEAAEGFVSLDELIARKSTLDPSELSHIAINPTDPGLFLLSGGTTGIPKLIPRTHNDYVYNSKMAGSVTGIDDDSVLLDVLPISHNLPLACPGLQGFLFKGAKVVLSTDTSPEAIFRLVEMHRVTHIHVVPALLIRWINDPAIGRYDLSSLRVIQSGGQRLQPETRSKTQELIPSVTVQENFGMAEGVLMFVRLDDPADVRLETVGRPICPDDEIMLLDEDDNIVPFGEVGEFCCRGPYTLRGYYGAEEHNKRAFTPDGFYRSGDLMRQHASGNYMVEGRKKDLINRGGEKISAEEIENLILSHPDVQNVACVPVPDPDLGERMCACLVLRPGSALSFDGLIRFLETKDMAKIKLPERLLVLDELPLSNFGKVSKKRLSEIAIERAVVRSHAARNLAMRKIDLHAYPGTREWIDCQGPYVEALATYWKREWKPKPEADVIAEFEADGVDVCLVALDLSTTIGTPPCSNDYTAAMRDRHPCVIQAWGAVEPAKGQVAIDEARHAIRDLKMMGFHFHPIMQHFSVDDPRYYPLFEEIAALGAPVMIDVGMTGMGAGMPGGMGAKTRHAHPSSIDALAADFPSLKIIMAHPGYPWIDETTAVALHKGNVYWEMSGWAPKYLPPGIVRDMRGRLQDKMMFGSDYPSIPYPRLFKEWDELGLPDAVMEKFYHANAERVLGL